MNAQLLQLFKNYKRQQQKQEKSITSSLMHNRLFRVEERHTHVVTQTENNK